MVREGELFPKVKKRPPSYLGPNELSPKSSGPILSYRAMIGQPHSLLAIREPHGV